VVGQVTASTLRLRKRIRYNNSFQTRLTATMEPAGRGTLIRGKFALHPFTRVFLPIWFGGVLFFCAIAIVALVSHPGGSPQGNGNGWMFLLIPLGMLVFGLALVRFGRFLARDEQRFLTEFLRQTLDAREAERVG
jgi:hypothetical protein